MLGSTAPCYLEWVDWSRDLNMGLNHQLASLSCALAEAFYLNRTLLFPERLCVDIKHESRWGQQRAPEPQCEGNGVAAFSVPTSEILDLRLLSQFVGILPTRLPRRPSERGGEPSVPTVRVDRKWRSSQVAAAHPCGARDAVLVQRRLSGFWFRPCAYGITDGTSLLRRVHRAVRARGAARDSGPLVTHLLRSGLFYSAAIKAAARALRLELGGAYTAVHVRRTDQFSTSCNRGSFTPAQCAQMELMTRPAQIGSSLALWLPPHSRVYIASDEPPAFFAPLRAQARRGRGRGLEGLLEGCGC